MRVIAELIGGPMDGVELQDEEFPRLINRFYISKSLEISRVRKLHFFLYVRSGHIVRNGKSPRYKYVFTDFLDNF